jgi:hypothetical protein
MLRTLCRMFPSVGDKGIPGQSPLVSPLMPADSGLTPPSRANHLGHLLGGPSAFGTNQKRHDVFMSGGGRRGKQFLVPVSVKDRLSRLGPTVLQRTNIPTTHFRP